MPRTLLTTAALRLSAAADSEVLATLDTGDVFEVLELAGTHAWGVAPGHQLVGYIDASALANPQ